MLHTQEHSAGTRFLFHAPRPVRVSVVGTADDPDAYLAQIEMEALTSRGKYKPVIRWTGI